MYTDWVAPGEPWNIVGLISPEFGEPVFGQYLASERMMRYVRAQIGDRIRIGWLGIFTNPYHDNHNLGWHRDVGSEGRDLSEEAELEFLRLPRDECRWELALVDDTSLELVPGSHLRYRTETEWDTMSGGRDEELRDERVVELRAGQTLFWNGKLIHRSRMRKDRERLTIAASWHCSSEEDPKQEAGRFRWMLADEVRSGLPALLHPYYDRWKSLQEA